MSIIHEALKKAAQIKKDSGFAQADGSTGPKEPDANIAPISSQTPKAQVKNFNLIVRAVPFVFAAGLIAVAALLIYNYRNLKGPEGSPAAQQTPSEPAAPVTLKGILPKETPANEYVLSGIVYEDKEPMAVINDKIYFIGDDINGAQVVEITYNRVLLKKSGKLTELKVK